MTIKIVSLNLWHGGTLMPQIIAFLKHIDADIVALQEVFVSDDKALPKSYHSIATLQGALDYRFAAFAPAFITDLPVGMVPQGNAVLSRFPIVKTQVADLLASTLPAYRDEPAFWPIEPRILQIATIKTPVAELCVANMHGVWDLDGDNPSQNRQHMVDVILKSTANTPHVIVTGDTNAKDSNPAMVRLGEQLASVFGSDIQSTFNMRRKTNPGYATAAVDHMYISNDLRVVSKACPDVDISDHLPLVVTLEVQ
jgi:endonuclease/exonuclease/phosphatase family metal-dependent hydrolase